MDTQNLKHNSLLLLKGLFRVLSLACLAPLLFFSFKSHAKELRIVSLSPAITEILFELGLGKNIVGTTSFSNFPEEAKQLPIIGSYLQPSIEKIIRLAPTHVLVFKEGDPSIEESLKKANLNYTILNSRTLEDYEEILRRLGKLFNVQKKSDELLDQWKAQWAKLSEVPRTHEKILIQVDHMPIYVAGKDTFISKAFEKCALKNVFANLDGYKKVQLETVLNRKPQIIIVVGMLNNMSDFTTIRSFWRENPVTKEAKIIQGDGDALGRLSPRFPSEVIKVCSQIKPLKASE